LPSIEAKGQYLNNINNSPVNRQDDYILSARPNVSLSYISEVTKIEGKLALLGLHYMQNSGLDRINQYYWLTGSHNVTPRLSLRFGGSFITDSTTTQELITSGTLINRQLRTMYSVNPGFAYFLTERLSTSIDYGFNVVDYQSLGYNNYKGQILTHGFDYLLNEKITILSRLTGTYYKYDSGNTIYALGPQVGFSYKYMEKWDMTFLGGLNINRVESDVGVLSANNQFGFINVAQQEQKSTNISPFFSLGTNYNWETGSLNFNYTRSQSANAYGNQSQYNGFNLFANQSISDKLALNANPYFYTSTIDNPGSDYNSLYYGIRPGISYKLTEKATLGASYGFGYVSVAGTNGYAYPVNDVWLTFNYSYPIHFQH
jgi:hypothetical protein